VIPHRSDASEFSAMLSAAQSLGIPAAAVTQLLQCVAAVLHLGNLTFAATNSRDPEAGCRCIDE